MALVSPLPDILLQDRMPAIFVGYAFIVSERSIVMQYGIIISPLLDIQLQDRMPVNLLWGCFGGE